MLLSITPPSYVLFDKVAIADRIPARIRQEIDEFHCCTNCQQIYWKGWHF
jgi:uncharacterized protein